MAQKTESSNLNNIIFNENDPKIKDEILRIILQYLTDERYFFTKAVLQDEANLKAADLRDSLADIKKIKKAILEGDWPEIDRIILKPSSSVSPSQQSTQQLLKNYKSFLYSVYRQQYLEYIDHHETQKAFTHLNKRLKPLEHLATSPHEFKDLCYLLTAKSVHDAPSFKSWEGVLPAREKLVEQFQLMLNFETQEREGVSPVPDNRLLQLLRQAVAYQIETSRYHLKISTPKVSTLLQDYTSAVIPNAVKDTFTGHTGNVKCVEFVGEEGRQIISGSSDNSCRLWDLESTACIAVLEGHTSRVWSVSSDKAGKTVASTAGDGTVKIWDVRDCIDDYNSAASGGTKANSRSPVSLSCASSLSVTTSDLYTIKYHPSGTHLVVAGYDKMIRLIDIERNMVVKTFSGHQLSVSKAVFSPIGNLIISGSKDSTIKFWDIVSGLCIKTISSHLGEVTSVEMNSNGVELLSSSKDNSNRLWDIRLLRPIRKFKGHQNTSKNFIQASFASIGDSLVIGGSEDGILYTWDAANGNLLQRLRAHEGIVYSAAWNAKQSMFCSCSDDKTVRSWWYDEKVPTELESKPWWFFCKYCTANNLDASNFQEYNNRSQKGSSVEETLQIPSNNIKYPSINVPDYNNSIHRTIHQTYKSIFEIPVHWRIAQSTCRDLHHHFTYIFWSDDDISAFINNTFPWFAKTFHSYPYPIQRVDAARYFILYYYGGIYLDLDIACLKPLDNIVKLSEQPSNSLKISGIVPKTEPVGISNDVLAFSKGHPFLEWVINRLESHKSGMVFPYLSVFFSTGPAFLTRMLWEYNRAVLNENDRVRVLGKEFYSDSESEEMFFKHITGNSWHEFDFKIYDWISGYINYGKSLILNGWGVENCKEI
ncbi:hypothetical protein HK098_003971 [Nowakowskiella sp. JEL0407]|nr:hypothetical protein HK098_003971 [Nowakowskiella sp. JEL0407]